MENPKEFRSADAPAPSGTFSYTDAIKPKYDVMEYIKEHSQEQFSIMEKIFIVCKTWSENLVPSLERHLQDVQEYSRRFLIEIEDLPYEPPDDSSSCPCCWEFSPRTDCFDEWEDYVLHRKEYAERLLLNFRDFVNDARERDANFAPAKGPDDETTGSQEMEMVIREKKC